MYKINNGEELIIEGTITGERIVGNWEHLNTRVYKYDCPDSKHIRIVCGKYNDFIVADHIHNKLVGNQNYIDSHIVLNFDKGVVNLYIANTSTDDIEIDDNLNISIIRRHPNNVRLRVGLEFMMELDIDHIESYDDNIRPVIEELIKQINSANIEGFRGINKTCWLSDRDPDYNEMVLNFTV